MPDSTPLNAQDDSVAEILALVHPARPSVAVDAAVTNAWATHDFYATNNQPARICNAYGTPIRYATVSYQTGAIGNPTTVTRIKYYPQTADEKLILDEQVTRGLLVYAVVPPAPV